MSFYCINSSLYLKQQYRISATNRADMINRRSAVFCFENNLHLTTRSQVQVDHHLDKLQPLETSNIALVFVRS